MDLSFGADASGPLQVAWNDGDRIIYRGWRLDEKGQRRDVLVIAPAAEHPSTLCLTRLSREYGLKEELDGASVARPLALLRERGRTLLVLEYSGGELLELLLGEPMPVPSFLRLAIGITIALDEVQERGLIHKDLKPANILVEPTSGRAWLMGFGLASRLPRERQPVAPPEEIAGTLAYMAPEQTGWMNRSVDARSDLYALGVTFYRMLTGVLPFAASDPLEWVHCHIARQPLPLSVRRPDVPAQISAIVLKLLAKTAEERYQTSSGLAVDLKRCLADLDTHGRVENFRLGARDVPSRLLVPEKLYGRESEIDALIAAFDRIAKGGPIELLLVSGYSGVGKSSVVNELRGRLVPLRGLFASGKFDQYKRDIPYSSLAEALSSLVRPLLSKSDAALEPWRQALMEALGPNAGLMAPLIPELEPLIGPSPPAPELPPKDALHRFQLVFRQLLGVFARPEHPLALLLDDLQWLDAATLDLLEYLATRAELRHLLLIGAYRDNEVTPAHPLMGRLAAIRGRGGRVQEIVLTPLGSADVGRLVSESLHCEPAEAAPLVQVVHQKTAGNPFFAIQFLSTLADEGLLVFDRAQLGWSWDFRRIHDERHTDNVIELMLGKLRRLSPEAQSVVRRFACLGNSASRTLLGLINGESEPSLDTALLEAERAGVLLRQEEIYRFLHDRVHEAAYALIPEEERAAEHLRIGRLLAAGMPSEPVAQQVFEIAGQLNRGLALIGDADERERLAELNLNAGESARTSTAYGSALTYFVAGLSVLEGTRALKRGDLVFRLAFGRAQCEFLTGALTEADRHLAALAGEANTLSELAAVTTLRAELFTTLGQVDRAVSVCLECLRRMDIHLSAHPCNREVSDEYKLLLHRIGSLSIEQLAALPPMADPARLAAMEVLSAMIIPAQWTDPNLRPLLIGRMVNLSLDHGDSETLCVALVWLGAMLGPQTRNYEAGFRFGQMGLDLVERRGPDRFKARVRLVFGCHTFHWTRPISAATDLVRNTFALADKLGDVTFASYSLTVLIANLIAVGERLDEVERKAEEGLRYVQNAKFGLVADMIAPQLQLVRTLRGQCATFGRLDDAAFDEARFEMHLQADRRLAVAECWYWVRKLQALVLAADYQMAVLVADRAERVLWTSPTSFEFAEYHFYAALARAGYYDEAGAQDRGKLLGCLRKHHQVLAGWVANCPQNFENRAALVGAEIARIEGRDRDAMDLYETAIRSAREHGFIHNEALASEIAARFYSAAGFDKIELLYLREARDCYVKWGAAGKVRQLDLLRPDLKKEEGSLGPTDTVVSPVEQLDLATVIKVSQSISGEILFEKLLEALMRIALQQAGAERGLLILADDAEHRVAAEATTDGNTVVVHLEDEGPLGSNLPDSILRFVLRTREAVVLADASAEAAFASDPYIIEHRVRSALCLPLLNQAKLIGMLYLENTLAVGAFAPGRVVVLKLLASQAATALDNTRLYHDLAEREAKIRHLVEANIIGIVVMTRDGYIGEANDAFLRMVGYDREDLIAGRLRWKDMTPPEWRERTERAVEEVERTGNLQPYEKEYFRKDGSRVPVLIGTAEFDQARNQSIGFVLDLTARKRAEAEARESERRLREAHAELAHANRISSMGQLTASIAHEVKQPIATMVTNARVGLRWLDHQTPDLEEIRQAFGCIVESGHHATEVIERIRALVKKSSPQRDRVLINEAILEVIKLTRHEAEKNRVAVRTDLADGLPPVDGDRVQLQQVVLNLILNALDAMSDISEGPRELMINSYAADGGGVLAVVRDTGRGLDSNQLRHLFEAFYTTKDAGLGMGLAICRSIIEAHEGHLSARPNEPRGAVFQFSIPPTQG